MPVLVEKKEDRIVNQTRAKLQREINLGTIFTCQGNDQRNYCGSTFRFTEDDLRWSVTPHGEKRFIARCPNCAEISFQKWTPTDEERYEEWRHKRILHVGYAIVFVTLLLLLFGL